jgi:hypothetical protein
MMVYQMQEGHIRLDGPWQDQSVNVLVPQHLGAEGVNLVVARDALPSGMEFAEYLDRQKQTFSKELPRYNLHIDAAVTVDRRPAQFLEFTWENQGNAVHQMMGVVHDKGLVLTLTATVRGNMDETVREALLGAIRSFRFGPAQAVQGHLAS